MKINTLHNGDDVYIAWKPVRKIQDCRGFALFRRRNGVEEIVSTWVGFEGDSHADGERRASTNWPIQRYQWTDYMASPGDKLQYRVIPMVGPDKENLRADTTSSSEWTTEFVLNQQSEPFVEVHFNRGIVAAQWVSRRLGISSSDLKTGTLRKLINTPGDSLRAYLFGTLGKRLLNILTEAESQGGHIFAALYELDDVELESAIKKLGKRAHIVLANGSVKKIGEDQNKEARENLKNVVDLSDRMISPKALGHNKFLIICDSHQKPIKVWTGSQNWTKTGLCTQANNSILITDESLAAEYMKQWSRLRESGNDTPSELKIANGIRRKFTVSGKDVGLWFTPMTSKADLNEARKLIEEAQDAILFLMFNPGPKDTLLNQIIDTARSTNNRLYIKGAINQDPSTTKNPVELFNGSNSSKADFDVVLPAAIDAPTLWFRREMQKLSGTFAMVHSKCIVIDPLGANPIVITGSHNLGPKASGINDENLLIIKGSKAIAEAYTTNIMSIYNQYRWRFRRSTQTVEKRWNGLVDNDNWQDSYLRPESSGLREMQFWVP